MPSPTVSVVMSVFNNRSDLPAVLRCLRDQEFTDYEVVVIDDGSTDGSGEVLDEAAAADPRIRVIHQENRGLGPALHRACTEARGEFLARQDADDLSSPGRLARQVSLMATRSDLVLTGTWTIFFTAVAGSPRVISTYRPPDDDAVLRSLLENGDNPFVHGSIMMRADAYRKEGRGYRLRRYCEEFDLWLRLARFGRFGMLESAEYAYRLNPEGMSANNMLARGRLVDLCLRLHAERSDKGAETIDWAKEEAVAIGWAQNAETPEVRAAAGAYSAGITAMHRGDWDGFERNMALAAAGPPPYGPKAALRHRLRVLAPLMRAIYRVRARRTTEGFHNWKGSPAGASLPWLHNRS